MALLGYMNEQGIPTTYTPQKKHDTLIIPNSKRKHIEVYHKYRGIAARYFLLKSGDTVTFSYDQQGYPFARSLTSQKLTEQYNMRSLLAHNRNKWAFSNYDLLNNEYLQRLHKLKNNQPKIYNSVFARRHVDYIDLNAVYADFSRDCQRFRVILDSAYQAKAIIPVYYHYYTWQIKKEQAMVATDSMKLPSKSRLPSVEEAYTSILNDSLLNYYSYQPVLRAYLFDVAARKYHIQIQRSETARLFDFRQAFDSLSYSTDIPQKTREALLFFCMENIAESFSGSDIQTYLEKYKQITHDTIKSNYITSKYQLDFSTADNLLLSDTSGVQTTFQKILEQHRGKVIYIDFWASWCAPCQRLMPAANELRKTYHNKEVSFIYLAKNDKPIAWKKAVKKFASPYPGEHYFIENGRVAESLKDLSITSIPHFLLYDKTGKIVHKNAPGPETEEIKKLLNKHIQEE
jgi:thiol-disulfide isomerase/thioredoxin